MLVPEDTELSLACPFATYVILPWSVMQEPRI